MSTLAETVDAARAVQADWEFTPVKERLKPIRALRHALAADPRAWAFAIDPPQQRTLEESLAAEIGPLADGCRWLEKQATRVLRDRREGGWFESLSLRVRRKPLGVVVVIGASNYPLYLLAAPAIQALAAGNAVLLKPPPGGEAVAARFHEALLTGGLNPALCVLLDASVGAAEAAIDAGVDHVVVTGSAETGKAVAKRAAERLISCTLECSGSDAVLALDADAERVAACVAWGAPFNSGATCIGPRRLIALDDSVIDRVAERLGKADQRVVAPRAAETVRRVVRDAIEAGGEVRTPRDFNVDATSNTLPPIMIASVEERGSAVARTDVFGPVLSTTTASNVEAAVQAANRSPYALGASVFGSKAAAENAAERLRAGCVTINDLIAPTADPRVPFGGAGLSGYGVTRGREGLLAMTRPQAIVRRRGKWLPHLDPVTPALADLLTAMIQLRHAGGWKQRWGALRRFLAAARSHSQLKDKSG